MRVLQEHFSRRQRDRRRHGGQSPALALEEIVAHLEAIFCLAHHADLLACRPRESGGSRLTVSFLMGGSPLIGSRYSRGYSHPEDRPKTRPMPSRAGRAWCGRRPERACVLFCRGRRFRSNGNVGSCQSSSAGIGGSCSAGQPEDQSGDDTAPSASPVWAGAAISAGLACWTGAAAMLAWMRARAPALHPRHS